MTSETELQMVQRHVREGADVVSRQVALVAELAGAGHDVAEAQDALALFENIQAQHVAHLARLMSGGQ